MPQHGDDGLLRRSVRDLFNPLEQARPVQQEVDDQHQQIARHGGIKKGFQGMFFSPSASILPVWNMRTSRTKARMRFRQVPLKIL